MDGCSQFFMDMDVKDGWTRIMRACVCAYFCMYVKDGWINVMYVCILLLLFFFILNIGMVAQRRHGLLERKVLLLLWRNIE